MELVFKIGTQTQPLEIPGTSLLAVLEPNEIANTLTGEAAVQDALRHPIGTPTLRKILHPGETVAIKDGSRQSDKFKAVLEANSARPTPKWLDVDAPNAQAKIAEMPTREDIDLEVDETLIVELYSK